MALGIWNDAEQTMTLTLSPVETRALYWNITGRAVPASPIVRQRALMHIAESLEVAIVHMPQSEGVNNG